MARGDCSLPCGLRRRLLDLAIICTSIQPADAASKELERVAHLLKPFRLAQLERAIAAGLRAQPI